MSTLEMKGALQACKLFLDEYEIEGKTDKRRCRRFFEVVKYIRLSLQVTTELLKRIEALEEEINNLKLTEK